MRKICSKLISCLIISAMLMITVDFPVFADRLLVEDIILTETTYSSIKKDDILTTCDAKGLITNDMVDHEECTTEKMQSEDEDLWINGVDNRELETCNESIDNDRIAAVSGDVNGLNWLLEDGTLTIYPGSDGSGEMIDFANGVNDPAPWLRYQEEIENIVIKEGVKNIGDDAFIGCSKAKNVLIPNTVTQIGVNAFNSCESLNSVDVPDSVVHIGQYAFRGCSSLKSAFLSNSVKSIGGGVFSSCVELDSVVLSESLTSISPSAFHNCGSLESVEIPSGVTNIGRLAFCYAGNMTSIRLPKTIKSVDDYAFAHCKKLTDTYYQGSEEQWLQITFSEDNSDLLNSKIHYNYDASTDQRHTVIFDSNGGTVVSPRKVEDGKAVTKPSNPVKNNYNFIGWYSDEGLTQLYDFSTPVKSDFTLFAKWENSTDDEDRIIDVRANSFVKRRTERGAFG